MSTPRAGADSGRCSVLRKLGRCRAPVDTARAPTFPKPPAAATAGGFARPAGAARTAQRPGIAGARVDGIEGTVAELLAAAGRRGGTPARAAAEMVRRRVRAESATA
ncbi:hypothetical protein [Actinomadura sp. WMMB 499]|uniref:hypothetical protein n=1 Tax=Actinomadura sp. WMMB 499 TaxID=1219491 RepID=UPI001248649C|nr:hypothetical protein [Actinomadura sp. WMMB 499]QFG23022.1 hypothetical protein F7P10_19755 [Actinomadura sp. WMMB 499]